jgi:2,3-dihydroxybenzoate-AMP ligase
MAIEGFVPFPPDKARLYTEKGYWEGLTLGDVLDRTVQAVPNKEAIWDQRVRVTYAELQRYVDRLALGLLELGVQKDDRIVVQLPNWAEFIYLYLAMARIGAIGVMALPAHRAREIEYLARLTEAVALVIPDQWRGFSFTEMARQIKPSLPALKHVIVAGESVPGDAVAMQEMLERPREREVAPDYLRRFRPDPNDVAVLLTTGGTTAMPKGVPRTHNDYIANSVWSGRLVSRNADTPILICTPIAHNAALMLSVGVAVAHGAKMVLIPRHDPEEVCRAIQQEKLVTTILMPTQAIDVLSFPGLHKYDLSSWRDFVCGGSHVPPELVREAKEKLGCTVHNLFGMAEGPVSGTTLEDPFDVICETVGRPCCPDDEVKIVDDQGREVPRGEVGELLCRGPHTFYGYYKAPEVNQEAFEPDGFHHTGDYARIDHRGRLQIVGRKKDIIIRGGENISSFEIEELLMEHPKVENVAVIGMPDKRLGERVCAYIKPQPGQTITFDEVVGFLMDKQIAKFKLPERLEVVEEFPLSNVGKILKRDLVEDIKRKLEAEGKR